MAWTRQYGVTDSSSGVTIPVQTASTSTVVLEDESQATRWEPDLGGLERSRYWGFGEDLFVEWWEGPDLRDRPRLVEIAEDAEGWYRSQVFPSGGAPTGGNVVPPSGVDDEQAPRSMASGIRRDPLQDAARLHEPDGDPGLDDVRYWDAATPDPGDIDLPFTRLRMFGIDYEQLRDATSPPTTRVLRDYAPPHPLSVAAAARYHIAYIESDVRGRFALDETSTLWYTWVPSARVIESGDVEVWSANGDIVEETDVPIVALYKDPFVVQVPEAAGGGWLMLVGRVRFRKEDLAASAPGPLSSDEDYVAEARRVEPGSQHVSIADIVAWHCTSQTFRDGDLSGPHLVVDSLEALESSSPLPGHGFRVWLGAPTGIFCGEGDEYKFYVYFNFNRSYKRDSAGNVIAFDRDASYRENAPTYTDSVEYSSGESGFRSGVAVHAVAIADVAAALRRRPLDAEEPWRRADAWPSTINQPVRYFVEEESGRNYEPFRDAMERALLLARIADSDLRVDFPETIAPRSSDPAAVLGMADPYYFVTMTNTNYAEDRQPSNDEISVSENTLLGVWRFAFLPTDVSSRWLFGRDLGAGLHPKSIAGRARDQITRTYKDPVSAVTVAMLDADPVWLADGARPAFRLFSREDRGETEPHGFYVYDESSTP